MHISACRLLAVKIGSVETGIWMELKHAPSLAIAVGKNSVMLHHLKQQYGHYVCHGHDFFFTFIWDVCGAQSCLQPWIS